RVAPRFPGPLVVVGGGIAVSALAGLDGHGVAVVGSIASGLPHIGLPSPSLADTVTMAPTAAALFLLTFAEGVLVARSFAGRHDQHVNAGQELLALGAANAAAGLSQGFPVGASNSRTAVNDAAGVRTQVAGLLAAAVVALILLFLTGPIANLPTAVLAAVIIAAATGLVDVGAWRELARNDHVELAIAAVTTAGVIVTGVLSAIAFAVGLSLIDVVRRSARPHDAVLGWVPELGRYADVSVHRAAHLTPGVVVYRLDDRLFFANAGYVKARVREAIQGAATPTHALVFDAEGVNHIDVAGLDALRELKTGLARDGVTLVVARAKSPLEERLGEAGLALPLYPTVSAAVASCAEHVSGGTRPRAPSR
ncbi:MAG TPA: SulP family inorganic anion transporter, partial [Solirubrobacteraceae bacterium]